MAQKQRKQQKTQPSGLKGFYILLGALAVIGLGALAWMMLGRGGSPATEPVQLGFETSDLQTLVERAEGVDLGSADAPVRVIEFADYQCPACSSFAGQMKPVLEQRYIEPGRVRFTLFDFPITQIHPNAFLAARAARCAGDQDSYWPYHDLLFARQSTWSPQQRPLGTFVDFARQLGLDADPFEECLRSDRHAETVTAGALLADAMGVQSTPTVIINGQRLNDWRTAPEVIDRALGEG